MKHFLVASLVLILTAGMLILSSCTGKPPAAAAPTIRLADQFGLGYAPLTIMLEKKFLEKHLPGIQIERKKFGSGSAVREAIIAGDLDVGFMGIPPFLVGWDKGVDWKIAGALDSMPLLLLTYREEVKGIKDLGPEDKIALPGPGSNQHILLAMAAEQELGNARALDEFIVAMPHPDAATALLSRQDITCYYGAPPYQYELLRHPGIKQIGDAFTAFGEPFSYIVAVAAGEFYREQPQTYQAFCAALEESLHFIRTNPEEAAEILARAEKTVPTATYKEYLTWPGTNWDITPRGIMHYARYMQKAGYIKKTPTSWQEVTYPNLHSLEGS
ncbi:MAG: NitT/TauT family transport system substrate-binding protein [Bacillota bacterium]|nr:NitT/TauT family transport system substrate-binding protein [Bacillota bacterium]MDK2881832.1 NitT/TauT family transport system substrate-binding protein [Bacillota bacterium]MDK2960413.1 NitT/TauT family transport system substrate-binding protein [Bacillota bacterium]